MKTLQDRFWEKVDINKPSECWEWKASRSGGRYGQIKLNRKMVKAHRVSYVLHYGEIPDGLCVLHKCDNGICVNPSHLFIGTQIDNINDCKNKGRTSTQEGEHNGNSKLTVNDVINIRNSYTGKYGILSKLGRKYNVTTSAIFDIVNYKRWSHIPPPEKAE